MVTTTPPIVKSPAPQPQPAQQPIQKNIKVKREFVLGVVAVFFGLMTLLVRNQPNNTRAEEFLNGTRTTDMNNFIIEPVRIALLQTKQLENLFLDAGMDNIRNYISAELTNINEIVDNRTQICRMVNLVSFVYNLKAGKLNEAEKAFLADLIIRLGNLDLQDEVTNANLEGIVSAIIEATGPTSYQTVSVEIRESSVGSCLNEQ